MTSTTTRRTGHDHGGHGPAGTVHRAVGNRSPSGGPERVDCRPDLGGRALDPLHRRPHGGRAGREAAGRRGGRVMTSGRRPEMTAWVRLQVTGQPSLVLVHDSLAWSVTEATGPPG